MQLTVAIPCFIMLLGYIVETIKDTTVLNLRRRPDLTKAVGELGSVAGWKSLPIRECGEPLVALGSFSKYPQIATSSIYVGERKDSPYPCAKLQGSLFTMFVREGVAKKLAPAAALLPFDHMLLVWDAYRSLTVQKALFDYFVEVLEGKGVPHDQAIVDAQKFVSIPSEDPTRPPPHNTGGAVDLTIIRINADMAKKMERLNRIVAMTENSDNWKQIYEAEMERIEIIRAHSLPLEMGTVFDGVHPETATRFYEEHPPQVGTLDERRRDNRRLLYNVMAAVGFSNYPEEWWHFDFGNQFDMARTGRQAIYGGAVYSKDNEAHEKMRRGHYAGCVAISEQRHPGQWNKTPDVLYPFVSEITQRTGHLQHTSHPQAAAI